MKTSNPRLSTPPAALLAASGRLLRPLVRLMMLSGVTALMLTDVLRRLFVDVAVTELLTRPETRTDSRISLLTGINRKEIRRFREMLPRSTTASEVMTIASQIIARWLGSPPFLDEAGHPRSLPRLAEAGATELSFDALVCSVTSDIRPRAVLDNWLSLGLVRLAPMDRVVLDVDGFIPRPGVEDQLFYFARNLHDHVAAATANVSAGVAAPFLDRSVHYDELTLRQANELEAFARDTAVRAVLEVNRKALELVETNELPDGEAPRRVNFGVFVFSDNDAFANDRPRNGGGVAR
jgi:hypothetical protein